MIKTEKLYTFTVEDSHNFSIEELQKFALDLCLDRAPLYGWAPGFTVEVDGEPVMMNDKNIYSFSVYGESLEGANPEDSDLFQKIPTAGDRYAAAPLN